MEDGEKDESLAEQSWDGKASGETIEVEAEKE
jgi:hypothetical protein